MRRTFLFGLTVCIFSSVAHASDQQATIDLACKAVADTVNTDHISSSSDFPRLHETILIRFKEDMRVCSTDTQGSCETARQDILRHQKPVPAGLKCTQPSDYDQGCNKVDSLMSEGRSDDGEFVRSALLCARNPNKERCEATRRYIIYKRHEPLEGFECKGG